jgi:hypothetical protein
MAWFFSDLLGARQAAPEAGISLAVDAFRVDLVLRHPAPELGAMPAERAQQDLLY